MLEVPRLIGVNHGGHIPVLFGLIMQKLHTYPSEEFIEELRKLPKGTRIGIEPDISDADTSPSKQKLLFPCLELAPERHEKRTTNNNYFDTLMQEAAENGLACYFLGDPEISKNGEKLQRASDDKRTAAIHTPVGEKHDEMVQGSYADSTEANYIFEIEREREFLNNMRRFRPYIVVLGDLHASYWFANRELLKERHDIDFQSYSTDLIDENLMQHHFSSYPETPLSLEAHHIKNAEPNKRFLAARESTVRKYSAVKKGRIFPERKPQFIGTWDVQVPEAGLFEVYIESAHPDGLVEGTIEDVNGPAYFRGKIEDARVSFSKFYSEAARSIGAAQDLVYYEGFRENGECRGFFRHDNSSGSFVMQNYREDINFLRVW